MIPRSRTGSTDSSTWVTSGLSKPRQRWNIPSTALICERNAFPSPWPSAAPRTRPAISVTVKTAGTVDFGLNLSQSSLNEISGTGTFAVFGSIVQKGKLLAISFYNWILVNGRYIWIL